jgi:hypothetical protein
MSKRTQTYVLGALLVILVAVYFSNRNAAPVLPGVFASDLKYQPMNVEDPALRLDLLEKIHKQEYEGRHRDIFSIGPPPLTPEEARKIEASRKAAEVPSGPAPLDVPATFYGYASNPQTGKRQAFFLASNNEDVFIVPEGGTLMNRFKVVKIGNNTAELEEISSQRRTSVNLEQPSIPGGQ